MLAIPLAPRAALITHRSAEELFMRDLELVRRGPSTDLNHCHFHGDAVAGTRPAVRAKKGLGWLGEQNLQCLGRGRKHH